MQVASEADKTDDDVVLLMGLRNMSLGNNTVRARVWQPSDAAAPNQVKDAKKCELPSPAPTFLGDITVTTTDGSSNVGLSMTIPGTDLSLWDSRDIFDGSRDPEEKLAVFLDAAGDDGILENIGCCFLESEGDDERKIEKEFNKVYGPLGIFAPQTLVDAIDGLDQKYCDLKEDPSPAPAADVNVVDVATEDTASGKATGNVTLANSVIDGLSSTETVIPRIVSIAPVTTADGYCAGFDIIYDEAIDVDVYDTSNSTLTVGTPVVLNDGTYLEHIRGAFSSPDELSKDHLAVQLIIEDSTVRGTTTETITCGRFQDEEKKKTNLVCNPYSSVIGLEGSALAANGALTEITATSVPINGGVSAAQLTAYQSLPLPWYETLQKTTRTFSTSPGFELDLPS